jgi:hypothetical protein
MSFLTKERSSASTAESAGEIFIRRPIELAKAVLPIIMNEAADAQFVEVEDTLSRLNSEAEEMIQERGKPTRKLRRVLGRYAHRMLEITEQEPDLLDPRSISLIAHASDATGQRDLLETTLEQAHRADMTSDTDVNLQAIEAALELDKPFNEVMRTLNQSVIPYSMEPIRDHKPLDAEYDYLLDRRASGDITPAPATALDEHGNPVAAERPLFKN